ncbi:laforin-like [Vanessa cardui]|uniref:laforin-like n=1 Tax=Vanessa cardui TaxID=171605 RepID=UPI001F12C5E1|nr:laforin-like [Vanessa cardui]
MHKNSQHSARDSEIVRVSVSLPIAATLYLLTRTEPRLPTTILSGEAAHMSRVVDTCGRATYRITARPQFHVKLAARGGRAAAARSVAPEIVFGRGRAPSEAAPQSPCGSARAPASRPNRRLRHRTHARPTERGHERTARLHGARISVARRPRAASGALPARWPPCSGGGAWRCCGWSRSARLPPARPASARRRRLPPPAPRKMRPRRRLARPAQVRPPTLPNRRRRRRRLRSIRPHTPGGGGQAHAWAAPHCCARRARWSARTCAAEPPPQPPLPTP